VKVNLPLCLSTRKGVDVKLKTSYTSPLMGGQLQAPSALPPVKEPPVPVGWRDIRTP